MPAAKWDPERAERTAEEALSLARQLNKARAISKACWNLMLIENYMERDLEKAVEYGERALAIAREHDLPEECAYALHDLGSVYSQIGALDRALNSLEEARQLWRQLDDKIMLTDNLGSTSAVLAYTGEIAQATDLAEQAVELSQRIHSQWGQAYNMVILGWLLIHRGEVSRAIEKFEESFHIAKRVDFVSAANGSLSLLAEALRRFGDTDKAIELVENALSDARDLDPYCALLMQLKAVLKAERGERTASMQSLQKARQIGLQARAEPFITAWLTQTEIEVALAFGEFGHALQLAEEFVSHMVDAQMRMFIPYAMLMKAQALQGFDRVEEARQTLQCGQLKAERLGLHLVLMDLRVQRFELELEHGSSEEIEAARQVANQAVADIADHIEDIALRDRFLGIPRIRSLMGV
jgi:tetratricopeptide (TPR) repeat protein